MKTLYMIGGTMGVGKTTTCQKLKMMLPQSVFLDGDWCWDMHPFTVNEETKAMVNRNITALLQNFLHCSSIENVIFCWVMHQQEILDGILSRLDLTGCRVVKVSLVCSEEALRARLERDVSTGIREAEILRRSAARLPLYEKLDTVKIDVSAMSPEEAAKALSAL